MFLYNEIIIFITAFMSRAPERSMSLQAYRLIYSQRNPAKVIYA